VLVQGGEGQRGPAVSESEVVTNTVTKFFIFCSEKEKASSKLA
jgi:hypothetical protein